MDRPSFENIVATALRRLPKHFRQKLENISVQVEDAPSRALLRDMGIRSGTLLGLYQGVPLTERGWGFGNMLPDRIVIYQRPIEEAASSPDELEDLVRDTVKHELAHYFGFDDDELKGMEERKKPRRG